MKERTKIIVNISLISFLILFAFIRFIIMPDVEISKEERRKLKAFPKFSVETVLTKSGGNTFMDQFEIYAKDQFPNRVFYRKIHAWSGRKILGRKEINNLYLEKGHISKTDGTIKQKDFDWSVERIEYILDRYAGDNRVYMAMIPDKNYYLAPELKYPFLDFDSLENMYRDRLQSRINFLELKDKLSVDDYYYTDTHWKQDKIADLGECILSFMGKEGEFDWEEKIFNEEFYGVYYGQSALNVQSEEGKYLYSEDYEDFIVTCYDSGKGEEIPLMGYESSEVLDPYEFFLGGSKALITIENPNADGGKLILFRDSFGSCIAPILARGYSEVTLIDIRYISPAMLDRFVDFRNSDILFLYSSSVLNNSVGQFMK